MLYEVFTERENLLIREFGGLSQKARAALVSQLTQEKVISWLPATTVMVKMAQVSADPKLYKLLWLMRADFYIEHVITSYSIHYTKLYEFRLLAAGQQAA